VEEDLKPASAITSPAYGNSFACLEQRMKTSARVADEGLPLLTQRLLAGESSERAFFST
jgi:hypothetical protein